MRVIFTRKQGENVPQCMGYKIADCFGMCPEEMLFAGDEGKDIIGADRSGIVSVLRDRTGDRREFGQNYSVNSLSPLILFN